MLFLVFHAWIIDVSPRFLSGVGGDELERTLFLESKKKDTDAGTFPKKQWISLENGQVSVEKFQRVDSGKLKRL